LVCFDLDGTLVDSKAAIVGCFQASLHAAGFTGIGDEAIAANIGRPLVEMLDGLVDPEVQAPILVAYSRDFAAWDRRCTDLFPGVLDALLRLSQTELRLAITSSKSLAGIERVLGDLDISRHFSDLWGGDMVTQGKPHPEMLQRAMVHARVSPAETVLIGDTTYDIEMGVAAGVRSLAVPWGMHRPTTLVAAGASRVLTSALEIGILHDEA
jgi:phosphoglycolate phosphatase